MTRKLNFLVLFVFLLGMNATTPMVAVETSPVQLVDVIGGSGTANGLFNGIYGVVQNSTHTFVTDSLNNRVQIFDLAGNYMAQFPLGNAGALETNSTHLFISNSTHIVVTDFAGNIVTTYFGSGNDLQSVAVNGTHVLTVDFTTGSIIILNAALEFAYSFGSYGAIFDNPSQVKINDTHIIVPDAGNDYIHIFDHAGNYVSNLTASTPSSIAFHNGYYVTLANSPNTVDFYSPSFTYLYSWDSGNAHPFDYQAMTQVKQVYSNGTHIFVTDEGLNERLFILEWTPDMVTTETTTEVTPIISTTTDVSTTTETTTQVQETVSFSTIMQNITNTVTKTQSDESDSPISGVGIIAGLLGSLLLIVRKRKN